MLSTPPEKLKIKAGDIKVPIMNELNKVRRMVSSKAYLNPSVTNAINVITLAKPRRSPGMGWGIKDSEICRTHEIEAKSAILYML